MPILNVNKIGPVGLGQYWATKALQTDTSNPYGGAYIRSGYSVMQQKDTPSMGLSLDPNAGAPWGILKEDLVGQYNVDYTIASMGSTYTVGGEKIPLVGINFSQRPSYFNGPKTIYDGGSFADNAKITNINTDNWFDSANTSNWRQLYEFQSKFTEKQSSSDYVGGQLENALKVSFPLNFGIINSFGNTSADTLASKNTNMLAAQPMYSYFEIKPDSNNLTYTSVPGSSITIQPYTTSFTSKQLTGGENLSSTYMITATNVAQGGVTSNFSHTFSNSITSSNTQGTTTQLGTDTGSSSSSSTTKEFGFSNKLTISADVGVFGLAEEKTSDTMKASVNKTWGQVNSASFSTNSSLGSSTLTKKGNTLSDDYAFSTSINLDSMTPTGTKEVNGQEKATWDYTHSYTDPVSGETKTTGFDLVEGQCIKVSVQYNQGTVQNDVTGKYIIEGINAGTIQESGNNILAPTIGQIFYYSDQANAFPWINADSSILDGYTDIDGNILNLEGTGSTLEAQRQKIHGVRINGQTTGTTSANSDISIVFGQIADSACGLPQSNSPASTSNQETPSNPSSRLMKRPIKTNKIHDGLLVHPRDTTLHTIHEGHNGHENIKDSPGHDVIHSYGGDDKITIVGNKVQDKSKGDLVYSGNGRDVINARNSVGRNSIHTGNHADIVHDGKSGISVDLGSGNDIFNHSGGLNYVRLGKGADKIVLKNKRDKLTGTVVVPDFTVGEDSILDQKNQLNFKWDNKTSSFKSRGNNIPEITLYTLEAEQDLSPEFWFGMAIQNPELIDNQKSKHMLDWQKVRDYYGKNGIESDEITSLGWDQFVSKKSLYKKEINELVNHFLDVNIKLPGSFAINVVNDSNNFYDLVNEVHSTMLAHT